MTKQEFLKRIKAVEYEISQLEKNNARAVQRSEVTEAYVKEIAELRNNVTTLRLMVAKMS